MAKETRMRFPRSKRAKQLMKGESSSSNPCSSRHRDAARLARLCERTPMVAVDDMPSNGSASNITDHLPMEALQIDDCEQSDNGTKSMFSEACSQYTAFTGCTNPTFDAVHRTWRSGSKLHNDLLAVVKTVSKLIKEMNGGETDAEYFTALLSTLQKTDSEQSSFIAATSLLITRCLKKLNRDFVRKCFVHAANILHSKLIEQLVIDDPDALKCLISAFGDLLRCQPASIWDCQQSKKFLETIANFATHEMPWVRTMARRVLRLLINDPITSQENGVHPAASFVGEFSVKMLREREDQDSFIQIRILCMIEGVLHKMPQNTFHKLMDIILKFVLSVENCLKCAALQCIYRTVQRQPSEAVLSKYFNRELVLALREFTPPLADTNVVAYWMQALCEAHVCLAVKDSDMCYELLPETFALFISMFDKSIECLAEVASNYIVRLLERCLRTKVDIVSDCMDSLVKNLNIQTVTVWKHILKTQKKIFELYGAVLNKDSLDSALKILTNMREDDNCFCKGEIELVIGSAVRYAGVEAVLRSIPLNIRPDSFTIEADCMQFKRSWLLPVMRENITGAKLALFVRDFLPLSVNLHKKISASTAVQGRVYNIIQHQIWELLPNFLTSCADFEQTFPEIAHILGAALTQRPDIRLIILHSLRNILNAALKPDASPARIDLMKRYAQNYLEILFPLYISKDKKGSSTVNYDVNAMRLSSLETIRLYLHFTSDDLLTRYVNLALMKINDNDRTNRDKVRLLDLLAAFTRCGNLDCINAMFDAVKSLFTTTVLPLQKKAYRVLEEIYKRQQDPNISKFFIDNAEELQRIIHQDINTVWKSSRAAMLSIIQRNLNSISDLDELKRFIELVLDRIIICMSKTHSMHARSNAMNCFTGLCYRLSQLGAEDGLSITTMLSPILRAIIAMVNDASNDADKIRSAFVALNAFAQKFCTILDASHLNQLLHTTFDFVDDERPLIRLLDLRLVRILCQKLPDYVLHQYKDLLLGSVLEKQAKIDITHKVRKANRLLLEVLVDRYSSEILSKCTDKEEWLKQLKAIEKKKRRRTRLKKSTDTVQDEDAVSSVSARTADADTILAKFCDDSDEDERSSLENTASQVRSKANSVFLRDDEGDPTDLMDTTSMVSKVTTSKPTKDEKMKSSTQTYFGSKSGSDEGIKLTKDGRLVIENLDLPSLSNRKRKSKKFMDDGEVDESKKLKIIDSSDSEDENEDDSTKQSVWKPGGKGIHRDLENRLPMSRAARGRRTAKGDVKKKDDKYEPYLYVPLSRKKGKNMSSLRRNTRSRRSGRIS